MVRSVFLVLQRVGLLCSAAIKAGIRTEFQSILILPLSKTWNGNTKESLREQGSNPTCQVRNKVLMLVTAWFIGGVDATQVLVFSCSVCVRTHMRCLMRLVITATDGMMACRTLPVVMEVC